MVVAGPVFTEWYWAPIFYVLVFGPPVTVGAALLYLAIPRRYRRRLPGGRAGRVAGAYVLAGAVVIGGWAVVRAHRFQQGEEREARGLAFTPLRPAGDAGFRVTRAEVHDGVRSSLVWVLERDGARISASQHSLDGADLVPPTCGAGRALVSRFGSFNDRPCASAVTPGGRPVVLAREESPPGDRVLLAALGGSLVEATTLEAPDAVLLDYVDALEPVAAGEIDYER